MSNMIRYDNHREFPSSSPPGFPKMVAPSSVTDDGRYNAKSPKLTAGDGALNLLERIDPELRKKFFDLNGIRTFQIIVGSGRPFMYLYLYRHHTICNIGFVSEPPIKNEYSLDGQNVFRLAADGSTSPWTALRGGQPCANLVWAEETTHSLVKQIFYDRRWTADVARLGWGEGTGTGMNWKVRGSKFDELGEEWLLQGEARIMDQKEWDRMKEEEQEEDEEDEEEASGSESEMPELEDGK
ncbi:hypothetical protein BDY24DRAFT_397911 [Mrakia frigida]|uniref:uncharacterized protein n=1 Tax=Mrakia frigida TaxID=29902 RepID=UPI003FCBFC1A